MLISVNLFIKFLHLNSVDTKMVSNVDLDRVIKAKPWLILILIAVVNTHINLILPCLIIIKRELQTSGFMIQLSIIMGPGFAILSNIFLGINGNKYSPKNLLIAFILLFSIGCLICLISTKIELFLLGRMFQVLADSGIAIAGGIILTNELNSEQLGEYLGYNTVLIRIFTIFAPLLGVLILDYYGWRTNFLFLAGLATILLLLFYIMFRQDCNLSPNKTPKNSIACSKGLYTPISIKSTYNLFSKNTTFILAVTIPAIHITISSLLDCHSPIFFMEICEFTPKLFSCVKTSLVLFSVFGSFLYIYVLKKYGVMKAFNIGRICYSGFIIVIIAIVITSNYNNPNLIYIATLLHAITIDFIYPIGMHQAIKAFPKKENITLAVFALARNIISSITMLISAVIFKDSMQPIIILISIISIPVCYLLFLMGNYLKSYT